MAATQAPTHNQRPLDRVIADIERAGNLLPHPMYLFLYLFGIIAVASSIGAWLGATVTVPGSDETLRAA